MHVGLAFQASILITLSFSLLFSLLLLLLLLFSLFLSFVLFLPPFYLSIISVSSLHPISALRRSPHSGTRLNRLIRPIRPPRPRSPNLGNPICSTRGSLGSIH
ncbi:uncharacterized protein BDW47DRAFT_58981 [Aspergillus candidus]|uniref:Uncharacterized protein n=1 Tax=Aspergillus candidus TaxID=41067 RepID=A0A2I2F535_ASPCN|nr:hypothetical protein BDW47DRAFT_58981 [Aspergillus candidus]PLB35752.1 hypothetical protein BDW47DRAFT_58981 [Aspergillus candidus]